MSRPPHLPPDAPHEADYDTTEEWVAALNVWHAWRAHQADESNDPWHRVGTSLGRLIPFAMILGLTWFAVGEAAGCIAGADGGSADSSGRSGWIMVTVRDDGGANQKLLIERGMIHRVTARAGGHTEITVADSSFRIWEEHAVTASIDDLCSALNCEELE